MVGHKYGANAVNVKRLLGLSSYETAWSWLHKLRRAMVRPERDRLLGIVEVDELYVGGREKGVHGRQTEKEAIVVMLTNRVHLVAKRSRFSLRPQIHDYILEGLLAG